MKNVQQLFTCKTKYMIPFFLNFTFLGTIITLALVSVQ